MTTTNPNPYAPPTSQPDDAPEIQMTDAEAEALRRQHHAHEARLRTIGTLMMLGTINLLIGPLRLLSALSNLFAGGVDGQGGLLDAAIPVLDGLYATGVGALCLHGGINLRDLNPNHRTAYTVIACLWVLQLTLFTLFGLWALILIHSPAGKIVLSPRYYEARQRTPEIEDETSRLTWMVFLLIAVVTVMVALNNRLG